MTLPAPFTLQVADNSQIGSIKKLIFSVLEEYGLTVNENTGPDVDLNDIELHYGMDKKSPFWVLKQEREIVGTMALHRESETVCELRKMYLSKKVRGKGLGKILLKEAVESARLLGYKTIVLETDQVLKEAVSLYEKFGFQKFCKPDICERCDTAMKLELE